MSSTGHHSPVDSPTRVVSQCPLGDHCHQQHLPALRLVSDVVHLTLTASQWHVSMYPSEFADSIFDDVPDVFFLSSSVKCRAHIDRREKDAHVFNIPAHY